MERESDRGNQFYAREEDVIILTNNINKSNCDIKENFVKKLNSIRSFLSLTGGSILYCLSALSIIYGVIQIIGPSLIRNNFLSDTLPSALVLNIYELALLGVLVLIVVWREVRDDAISLLVLMSLFLIASGMILGMSACRGPRITLFIGIVCTVIGFGKLYIVRRYVGIYLKTLSFLGIATILAWNFLSSSVMAVNLADSTDQIRRSQWQLSWLVLLCGAVLVLIEAIRTRPWKCKEGNKPGPFLCSPSMVWIFVLVILIMAGLHQYGQAYMFVVEHAFGDYLYLIVVGSILLYELIRSQGKRFGVTEFAVWLLPFFCVFGAIYKRLIIAGPGGGIGLICNPAVILGLMSLVGLSLAIYHHQPLLLYVALMYSLGVLLTIGYSPIRPHELNWLLAGGASVIITMILGIIYRNVGLCFLTVIFLTLGLALTGNLEYVGAICRVSNLNAAMGILGLGTLVVCIIFGQQTERLLRLIGVFLLMLFVFDFLPYTPGFKDVLAVVGIIVLSLALWLRTGDLVSILILCVPLVPRGYLLAKKISSWGFVVLSFVLLFLGAAVSLFCKRKEVQEGPSNTNSPLVTAE
ncbi:MAG: hypothetical protein ACYSRQ_02870 [Planctomycetota bacterium]|jgi:hypothetical protein